MMVNTIPTTTMSGTDHSTKWKCQATKAKNKTYVPTMILGNFPHGIHRSQAHNSMCPIDGVMLHLS